MDNQLKKVMEIFGTDSKDRIQKIKFKTAQNYEIEGYISRKPNQFLGSIYVTKVDGIIHNQLIRGMPKLGYWDHYNQFNNLNFDIRAKEDGTNISFCALSNPYKNEVWDIIVKTRGVPEVAKDFKMMLDNLDTGKAYDYVYQNGGTLSFELFGNDNKHEICYNNDIDLKLLTGFDRKGNYLTNQQLNDISKKIEIHRPEELFQIEYNEKYELYATHRFFYRFEDYFTGDEIDELVLKNSFESIHEAYFGCAAILEEVNKNTINQHIGPVIEGTVWTGESSNGDRTIQVKCKPKSIRDGHISRNGIPSIFINKAIRKFKDDYPDAEEILENKPEFIIERVNDELLEDWDELLVKSDKTQSRIATKMHQILLKKEISEYLVDIAKKLVNEFPDLESAADYMRVFAQSYPDLRKQSRKMFNAISNEIGG